MEQRSKQGQIFSREYYPRSAQPARKHDIFTNFLELAFRICAIYIHVPEFYTRDNIFKRTVILNHPVDRQERETPKTHGGFRYSIFTRKLRAEDESTKSHAGTAGDPVAVF